jgi:polysaccharide pyruvyl transferase WcaK-like protein
VYRSLVKLSVLWNADKVVYAGGSLFSSLEKARIFFERIMMLSGIEFSAIGISVGPFSHPAEGEVVIGHLRKFSYLSVRDARSYQLLASHGIHSVLVPDIVYSVDYHGKAVDSDHSKARHRLLLVPAPVGAEHAAEQEYFYNSVHQIALANDWSVSFASFQEKDSTSNFFQFGTWLQYRDDGAEFLNDLSSFDYVISSRLHGGIVASLLGKPFYMFQHHQKITDFLADLNWPHRNRSIPADFLQELPRVIEDAHDLDYRNEIRQEAKSGIRSGILEVIGIKEKLNG